MAERIKRLEELEKLVRNKPKKTIAIAYGHDDHSLEAAAQAKREGIADFIITGEKKVIEEQMAKFKIEKGSFVIEDVPGGAVPAGKKAVSLVKEGKAHVLMKGLIDSGDFMRCILDKENGLLPPKAILSHAAVIDCPNYHKFFICTDVAVIPAPTLEEKCQMLSYCVRIANLLGIEKPKAAIITANEKVSLKMPATMEAAIMKTMGDRGQLGNVIVDGPLAVDVALDAEHCRIKKLKTEVGGDPDILVFPNIETGNAFYKACTILGKGEIAGVVTGALAPVILTSRADSEKSKHYSMLLALLMA
ncbi:MAG: phosphate acyltransferase [Thermoplasmata archaeon]